jgi:hypothetical protein
MSGYYTDIEDFPLYNWRQIQEKSLIKFVRKDINEGSLKKDRSNWEKIQDSFLAEFGLSKDYERILELQGDIAMLELDLVIEDNPFLQNKIRQLNRELDDIRDRGVESDMDDCIHYIEVWRKIEVDEYKMSVKKFFKRLNLYKKENAKNKES